MPHRSARRRRRVAGCEIADHSGSRDRRHGSGDRVAASTRCASAIASACPGSATPAASAAIAVPDRRICATRRTSPATRSTAATPTTRWPTRAIAFALPDGFSDVELAPWLCAGLIGYRALRMAGDARRIGIYGFGAAAHIVAQLARHEGRAMYAFTRPGDAAAQAFARELGAVWAGGSDCRRRNRSTRRSSSRRSARWCPRRCATSPKAASSSAPAFT